MVTIGVFDGVHRGHQATIGHSVKRAKDLGIQSVVVSFDPHPAEVVRPGSHPAVLTEPGYKAKLIEALGADVLCVVPFTVDFSRLTPEAFVHDVLVEHLHARVVVVGENFRFGHRAAGDIGLLERLGRTFGFAVESAPLVTENASSVAFRQASCDRNATVFSSTYIRACVAAGDVGAAAVALGRPHRLEGVVVRGERRGRELGFPTANVLHSRYSAVPAHGVYAGWLELPALTHLGGSGPASPASERRMAAISIGTKPTFAGVEREVEAHLLDFDGDLYGEHVALDFVAHLREMRRYEGIGPLITQMHEDVAQVRELLG